jgi:hypothetical protein
MAKRTPSTRKRRINIRRNRDDYPLNFSFFLFYFIRFDLFFRVEERKKMLGDSGCDLIRLELNCFSLSQLVEP